MFRAEDNKPCPREKKYGFLFMVILLLKVFLCSSRENNKSCLYEKKDGFLFLVTVMRVIFHFAARLQVFYIRVKERGHCRPGHLEIVEKRRMP